MHVNDLMLVQKKLRISMGILFSLDKWFRLLDYNSDLYIAISMFPCVKSFDFPNKTLMFRGC